MQDVARRPSKGRRGWKVVWSVYVVPVRGKYRGQGRERRAVVGRLDASQAYKLFWRLRGKPWVIAGPEMFRGHRRVL